MLGWDLTDFVVENSGGLASPFRFEIVFTGNESERVPLRGDGVVLRTGSVRFNRQEELAFAVNSLGLNAQNFFAYLADMVLEQSQPGASARA